MPNILTLEQKIYNAVTKFTYTFPSAARENFMNGNCYWFAQILKERFSPRFRTDIAYNQIQNHFCCVIYTTFKIYLFDASGAVVATDEWKLWSEYRAEEPLDAARVYRDCIWHLTEEEWNELPMTYKESPWNL